MARHVVGESGKVVACCSSKNVQLVKSVGADEVIDYTSVNLPEYLSQTYPATFDMVLDTVGSFDLYNATPEFLKPNADFMPVAFETTAAKKRGYFSIGVNLLSALFLPAWLGGVPRRFTMWVMSVVPTDLKEIAGMIQRREIKPVLDSVWKFHEDDVKEAYRKLNSGHAAGKVVISVIP